MTVTNKEAWDRYAGVYRGLTGAEVRELAPPLAPLADAMDRQADREEAGQ